MADIVNLDWAMLGWRTNDGRCHLLASRDLTRAELEWVRQIHHFESWEHFLTPGAFKPAWACTLQGTGSWTHTTGPTYAECLANLLFREGWRADTAPDALPTHDPIRSHLTAHAATRALKASTQETAPTPDEDKP